MVQFRLNQTIETTEPMITVDAGLPVGRHRFQLIVVDATGNRSQPAVAVVDIQREVPTIPTPHVVAAPTSPVDPGAPAPARPAVGPVVSPTRTVSPIASTRPTVTPTAPHALPDSPHAPTSAAPPRKARGPAKNAKRSPPRKPRPPRKEK